MRKAQAWSTDIMIAGAIFVLGLVIFLYIIGGASQTRSVDDLLRQANIASEFILSSAPEPCSFVDNNALDEDELARCAALTYSDIKSQLKVDADVCVHIEDEQGRLINISDVTGKSGLGVGDSRISYLLKDASGNIIAVSPC